jgi:hypothetical protein
MLLINIETYNLLEKIFVIKRLLFGRLPDRSQPQPFGQHLFLKVPILVRIPVKSTIDM